MPQSTRLYTAGQGTGSAQNRRIGINVQGANNASLPALQVVASSTAETQITDPAVQNTIPLAVAIPPGGPCEQEKFTVLASGYVKTAASLNVTLKLYVGDSATINSNTEIVTSGAVGSGAAGTFPFIIQADCVYDSVSGKIDVISASCVFNGTIDTTVQSNFPKSLSISNSNNPVVAFTMTVQFGTGETTNEINVKDFGINH
jgi:hypothetical protein